MAEAAQNPSAWIVEEAHLDGRDLLSLIPGEKVASAVVNLYLQIICREARSRRGEVYAAIDSTFFHEVFRGAREIPKDFNYERQAKALLERVPFERAKMVFVPLFLASADHWVLCVASRSRKEVVMLDSLWKEEESWPVEMLTKVINMRCPGSEWTWVKAEKCHVPQQVPSKLDCGVFICQMAESLARNQEGFKFRQENMVYFRKRMTLEIKDGILLT